jgi:RNA polymerase sigma-70 factor (ECF subfamily)
MPTLPSETALITEAVAGDRRALEQLLFRHYNDLMRHIQANASAVLRRQVDPEDLLQQTFLQAVRSIQGFEIRPEASFLTWLKAIANHRIRDAARKLGRHPVAVQGTPDGDNQGSIVDLISLIEADQTSPSRGAMRHDLSRAVHLAIAQLESPEQRDAVRLRYLEGLEIEEVANAIGCTPNAVRGLIHRAKIKLEEALERASRWMGS